MIVSWTIRIIAIFLSGVILLTNMRIYNLDGTFTEDTSDTEFGWMCSDIVIDEGLPNYDQINKETKLNSRLRKSMGWSKISLDIIDEEREDVSIQKYNPKIRIETIYETEDCQSILEGPNISPKKEKFLGDVDIDVPRKEDLIKLINPCNVENKMLLSVIYFSKYKNMMKEEASEELLKSVNMKATNFKCLRGE